MSSDEPRIDARVAIVSNAPFIERDGRIWARPAECRALRAFTCHFRRVTLVRPRADSGPRDMGWEVPPESMEARELRAPGDRIGRILIQAGVPSPRLPHLLRDADVIYARLPSHEPHV